jgi:hypothetical protein
MQRTVIQGLFPQGLQRAAHLRQGTVQRTGSGAAMQLPSWPPAHTMPGRPLDATVRQMMEAAFGQQFADVRIHVGAEADSIGAVAFTHGSNIYFAPGQYDPSTQRGRQVLAHELAHVVQQRSGRVRNAFGPGVAIVHDAQLEAEAERMATHAAQQTNVAPHGVAQPRVAQPLVYNRFGGLFGWMKGYNAEELRINALTERLRTDIADSKAYFQRTRAWMRVPGVLSDIERDFGRIDERQLDQTHYTAVERSLQNLDTRLAQLRVQWAIVGDNWRQQDPRSRITRYVAKSYGDVYYDSRYKNLKNARDLGWFVEQLFREFINYGFRYDASQGAYPHFLGTDDEAEALMLNPASLERYGSCITLAYAFATILKSYGIDADAEYVIPQNKTVISKVSTFIDPSVTSNIEYHAVKKDGYFVFTGHAAVQVKKLNKFYDPMAKASYQSAKPNIECTLTEDVNHGGRFRINGTCKTMRIGLNLVSGVDYYLVADPNRRVGGLATYVLTAAA